MSSDLDHPEPAALMITVADGESRAARTWPDGSWTCPFCESPTLPWDVRPWSGRHPCANPACIAGGRGSAAEVAEYRRARELRAAREAASAATERFTAEQAARVDAESAARRAAARAASRDEGWCYDCWATSTSGGRWISRPVKIRHRKPENCPRRHR